MRLNLRVESVWQMDKVYLIHVILIPLRKKISPAKKNQKRDTNSKWYPHGADTEKNAADIAKFGGFKMKLMDYMYSIYKLKLDA